MDSLTMSDRFFLTSPNIIGLPATERGDAPTITTRDVISKSWPQIEKLLDEERIVEAISSMEALAVEMRQTTMSDAPLFRDALTLARRLLYDNLAQIGRADGYEEPVSATLSRCEDWDEELRSYLEALRQP